jgi:hypothetical protein
MLKPMEEGEKIFETAPVVQTQFEFASNINQKQLGAIGLKTSGVNGLATNLLRI